MSYVHFPVRVSRATIAATCQQATPLQCLDHQPGGNSVLRLNSGIVVKYGDMVSEDEARDQALVSQLVVQSVVRVPKVYDWFRDEKGRGYLVMEFVEGRKADLLTEEVHGTRLRKALEHLHALKSKKIGPLYGNRHRSLLFRDGSHPTLSSVDDVTN